ncbi:rust resistance kinase Lr10-like [Coffea arabica]|uniref:Rust resistance kinase Lr10-like n=1 Tax=Coffea arabica TaxID=13443 RepID=A0A6P6VV41_COFAR|nr:rust resistance kinase Lr10-like isoform X1 [Coffea arabica]
MSQAKLSIASLLVLVLVLAGLATSCEATNNHHCNPSSCGDIRNISYPFRLKEDPIHCGDPSYELACENNRTIVNLFLQKYYVQEIIYEKYLMRVVDPGLDEANCSSFPINTLEYDELQMADNPQDAYDIFYTNIPVLFISCPAPVRSPFFSDIMAFCRNHMSSNFSSPTNNHSYLLFGNHEVSVLNDSCAVNMAAWITKDFGGRKAYTSPAGLYDALAYGFLLDWRGIYCQQCSSGFCDRDVNDSIRCSPKYWQCELLHPSTFRPTFECLKEIWYQQVEFLNQYTAISRELGILIGMCLAGRFLLGVLFLFALIIYKMRRSHLSMYENIEDFLQSPNNLMPVRYAYSDIRKMTNNFKDKLGEGGYGTVFKGKLRSGPLVAVKMLGKSKANGQEFISEVATIGRIHHANVVKLIGFCFEGSKRALVYEFMPNGSLEKYIFRKETETASLSCEKLFDIALGIAKGIDYLHRGCEMQILHFDIKPHNILLDEHFAPKLSDFGLAKLYPTENSIVSLTAARGTLGYMAPELYYKNIGGVSYKADVYSFGMLLLEMAGKRKNLNPLVEQRSQIYFPSWVYDQLSKGNSIEMGDASEDERKMLKKMILVALWCIQMKPINRPSMNKVTEMLEGDGELLETPPKPFQNPDEMPAPEAEDGGNDAEETTDFPQLQLDRVDSSDMSMDRD